MTPEPQIEAALRRNFGSTVGAACDLGLTRQAVWHRVTQSQHLQNVLLDIDETILDLSVQGMVQGILERDGPMIRYHLDRKGASRGFRPRAEVSGPNGGPILLANEPTVHAIGMPDDERELLRELLERQRARMLSGG